MRCDLCPLCPVADDDVCPESEGEYGIEHKDGMSGCKHPRNWAEKRNREYTQYLGDMGTDMGIEMDLSEKELKKAIELCKHMIGFDHSRPYHRHGKAFYKPYRNYFSAPKKGEETLDKLPSFIITKEISDKYVWYTLTSDGLKWLGRQLKITIKQEENNESLP